MNIIYTEMARQYPAEFCQLEQISENLKKIAGASGSGVTALWDCSGDAARHVYKLTLSDWSGDVSAEFYNATLWRAGQMRSTLLSLWGDLLQNRSHKLLDKLLSTGEPAEK